MIAFHVIEAGRLVGTVGDYRGPIEDLVWVDLHNPDTEEEKIVETMLGFQVPTRLEMAEIEESSRLYEDAQALVMTAVMIDGANGSKPSRTQVTFVLKPDRLVTVRYADPMPFRAFEQRQTRQPEGHTSASLVFVGLLESVVERLADILEGVESEVGEVSTAIFYGDEGIENVERRSNDLRALLIRLGRRNRTLAILRESLLSLNRLLLFARVNGSFGKNGTVQRLKIVERDIRSLSEHEARVADEISYLQDSTLGLINIEQNTIIKVFSIAAVLFLPPTLVGTVYGMNFDHMPELSWRVGYPLALAMMVASALIPYWWFRRKGWL